MMNFNSHMSRTSLADLLKQNTVESIIFPLLPELGVSEGFYRKHIDEVTASLVEKGLISKPEISLDNPVESWALLLQSIDKGATIIDSAFLSHGMATNEYRKKGQLLPLRFSDGTPKSLSGRLEDVLHQHTPGRFIVGYDWQGIFHTDQAYQVAMLTDQMRAEMVFRKAFRGRALRGEDDNLIEFRYKRGSDEVTATLRFYGGNDTRGYQAVVRDIPKEGGEYAEVELMHLVPYRGTPTISQIERSWDLMADHSCEYTRKSTRFKRMVFGGTWEEDNYKGLWRTGTEEDFCKHDQLALMLARAAFSIGGYHLLSNQIEFSDKELFFYQNLMKKVLVESRSDDGKVSRFPMDNAEMEQVMMAYLLTNR